MNQRTRYRMRIIRLALCAVLGWMPAPGSAQAQIRADAPAQPVQELPPSGAMLETSADADSLLSRAREYIDADQYREALLLLQHVTDNFGHLLTTSDGLLYVPARQMVEQTLRDLPPEGLREYRLTADGEARGLLRGKPAEQVRDIDALRQVAERYFISSVGDDAAMALAGHLLDQGRHHAARRWLLKVAEDHPDASVDPAVLQTRLLAASVGMDDPRGAERALKTLASMRGVDDDRLAMLRQYVRTTEQTAPQAATDWPMAYGGPTRNLVMPSLGEAGLHYGDRTSPTIEMDLWIVAWEDRIRLDRNTLTSAETGYVGAQFPTTRPMLIKRWQSQGWQPTSRAAISGDIAVYKIGETVTAIDTKTGKQLWRKISEGRVPGARQGNHANYAHYRQRASTAYPVTLEEMVLFGDRVGRAMSIIDGVVYHVTDSSPVIGNRARRVRIINGQRVISNGGSALQALDLKTGKVLWETEVPARSNFNEAGEQPRAPRNRLGVNNNDSNTRVLGGPIRVAGRLVVPVADMGELCLVALDAKNGEPVWRRFLCSAGIGYAPPWATIDLASEGGLIYVPTGRGLLIAADATTGHLQWASRYERVEPDARYLRSTTSAHLAWAMGAQKWRDCVAVSVGGDVVLLSADAAEMLVFDGSNGRLKRRIDVSHQGATVNTLVGIHQGRVILSGRKIALAIDPGQTKGRKLDWVTRLEGTTGAPVLAGDAMFAPVGDKVVRVDLQTGKWVSNIPVSTATSGPVGDLYSNGDMLLAMSIDGMVGLADVDDRLTKLTEQVEADDLVARVERGNLFHQIGMWEASTKDYREALSRIDRPEELSQAREALIGSLLELAAASPEDAQARLDEADDFAATTDQHLQIKLARASAFASAGSIASAVRLYSELAAEQSDELVRFDPRQPEVAASLSHVASVRIEALIDQQTAAVQPLLEQQAATMLAGIDASQSPTEKMNRLATVIEAYPSTESSLAAAEQMFALSQKPDAQQTALVESVLSRLGASTNLQVAAQSKLLLARMYEQLDWPEDALAVRKDVIRTHRSVVIGEGENETTAAILAADAIKKAGTDRTDFADPLALSGPPYSLRWKSMSTDAQVVTLHAHHDEPASRFLESHALLFSPSRGRLIMRDARNGQAIWSTTLPANARHLLRGDGFDYEFPGGRDGHILVIASPSQTTAIDLIDGRELWTREGTGQNLRVQQRRGLYQPMHIGSGVMLEIDWDDNELSQRVCAYDLLDGSLLWTRQMTEAMPTGVYATPQHAVIAVDGGNRLLICDLRTGLQIAERPVSNYRVNGLASWTPDGILFQANRGVGFVPFDGNQENWGLNVGSSYYRKLEPLNETYGYCVASDSSLAVFELATGKTVFKVGRNMLGNNTMSAAIGPDNQLYVLTMSSDGKNNWELKVFDVFETKKLTSRVTFSRYAAQTMDAATYATIGDVLPFPERDRRNSSVQMRMFHRADGKEMKSLKIRGPGNNGSFNNLHSPPIVRGGSLLVPTRSGVFAYGLRVGAAPEQLPEPEPAPIPEPKPAPNPTNPLDNAQMRINNGTIEVRMNGGGMIRASKIKINNLELRQNNGKIEIYRDGQLVEVRDANGETIQPAAEETPQQE